MPVHGTARRPQTHHRHSSACVSFRHFSVDPAGRVVVSRGWDLGVTAILSAPSAGICSQMDRQREVALLLT
eukprot:3632801-Rhodomonas_salina.2